MLVLSALGGGYALVVGPLAQPADDVPLRERTEIAALPPAFETAVKAHLSDADWTNNPKWRLHRGDTTMFLYNEIEPDPEDRSVVRLLPFALMQRDPANPDQPPHLVHCASAKLQFEGEFDLIKGEIPGRLIGGALEGDVFIRGPQNLELTGHSFFLSDEYLYSDHPVAFSFGSVDPADVSEQMETPVRVDGRADKLNIAFHVAPSVEDSLLSRDLPRVAGFRSIWLRRNVELTLRRGADPSDPTSQAEAITLASDGRLEYLVEERVLKIDDNVRIVRPTPQSLANWPREGVVPVDLAGPGDRLDNCDQIALVLTETAPKPGEAPRSLGNMALNLEPARLRAFGEPMRLHAVEQEAVAATRQLTYEIADRTVKLLGRDTPPAPGQPEPFDVQLERPGNELYCRQLVVKMDENNDIVETRANKGGIFSVLEVDDDVTSGANVGQERIRAEWYDGLLLVPQPDGSQQLTVAGDVQLREKQRDIAVAADKLTAVIESTGMPSLAARERRTNREPKKRGLEQVRSVLAEGDVVFNTPQAHVKTEAFMATIAPGPVGQVASSGSAANLFQRDPQTDDADGTDETKPARPVHAEADKIFVTLAAADEAVDLRSLQAVGAVSISQVGSEGSATDEDALEVFGQSAMLVSRGGSDQVITLDGSNARVNLGQMKFTSPQIVVDRAANTVTSPGGSATIPVKTAIAGESSQKQQLGKPSKSAPLKVDWAESMVFDGQRIQLSRDVKARQGDTELQCGLLTVDLNRRIDLSDPKPNTDGLDYDRVTCRDDVRLTGMEWHQTTLLTLRKASANTIVFDRASGKMIADGPGELFQWSRDRHAVIAPQPHVSANQGRRADDGRLRFVHLRFDGRAVAHAEQEWIKLDRKVELLHSYVDRPLQTTDREGVFDAAVVPTSAFFLECDRLEANLADTSRRTRIAGSTATRRSDPFGGTGGAGGPLGDRSVEVQAVGNVRLEGKQFRANSDLLTYNQQTSDFFLHGQGDHRASVWIEKQPGAGWDQAEADTIRLNPEKKVFKADGAEGFWTAF